LKEYRINDLWTQKFGKPREPLDVTPDKMNFDPERGDPNHHDRLMGLNNSDIGERSDGKEEKSGKIEKADERRVEFFSKYGYYPDTPKKKKPRKRKSTGRPVGRPPKRRVEGEVS
jgi:hypothetical protein